MDDFLSDLLGEDWDKDDPMSEVHDFGSFLSMLANELDEDSPCYHEVVNLDRQYNAQTRSFNNQTHSGDRHSTAQYHLQEANKYYQAKKWQLAINHLSEVFKQDYQDSNFYLVRGHCYHNLEEKELALKDINRAIDLDPKNAHAILLRTVYTLSENFEETIDDLLRYFQLTQENASSEVLDVFTTFLKLEDEHWLTVINKLSQFLQIDTVKHVPIVVKLINQVGGEHLFVRLCNLTEVDSDTVAIFALVFRGLLNTDVDKTLEILSESIKNNPDSSTHYYIRSQAYEHKSNWDAALKDINKAIELDPDDYDYYKKRAFLNLEKGKLTNVISDYEKYLSLGGDEIDDRIEIEYKIGEIKNSFYPDEDLLEKSKGVISKNNFELAKYHHDQGLALVNRSDFKGAINEFQKAINAAPGYAPAHVRMFEMYYQIGDWDNALSQINTAIELDPNDTNSYNNRAGVNFAIYRLDDAIKDFETIIELDPSNILAQMNLIATYLKQENWDKGLERLNQVMKINSSDPKLYYYWGYIHENKKNLHEAIKGFTRYCELGGAPKCDSPETIRERIENLKKDLLESGQQS